MTLFLKTERLILQDTLQSDFDNLVALRADPDVMKYVGKGVQTKDDIQCFLSVAIPYQKKHGFGFCSVFEKESGDFIGQAGVFHVGFNDEQPEIEVAYRLHKQYWGKGYGTELTRALIQWGFDHLPVAKLVAFVHPDNRASHRILQKCGMIALGIVPSYYGDLPKYEIYRNDAIELVPYNSEWPKMASDEIDQLRKVLPTKHVMC